MNQSNVIPTMRYRDAYAAIDWLVAMCLDFERHLVVGSPTEQTESPTQTAYISETAW